MERFAQVMVIPYGERHSMLEQLHELHGLVETALDSFTVGSESHLLGSFQPHGADTVPLDGFPDVGESDFLLEAFRIDHRYSTGLKLKPLRTVNTRSSVGSSMFSEPTRKAILRSGL